MGLDIEENPNPKTLIILESGKSGKVGEKIVFILKAVLSAKT